MPSRGDARPNLSARHPPTRAPEIFACFVRHQDRRNIDSLRTLGRAAHDYLPTHPGLVVHHNNGRGSGLLRVQYLFRLRLWWDNDGGGRGKETNMHVSSTGTATCVRSVVARFRAETVPELVRWSCRRPSTKILRRASVRQQHVRHWWGIHKKKKNAYHKTYQRRKPAPCIARRLFWLYAFFRLMSMRAAIL